MVQESPSIPQVADGVRPLMVGAEIPDVTLTTVDGEPFNLNDSLAEKPAIVNFYRGDW